ncbi:MAG TPA: uridylate kinase [Candidatus Limiplasma sp.]|nr:uridylate kinase [Candidatus Limiplasma sp.]HRX07612.1 uridylate kinase [Candidatus Limiplasma sp.]
MKQIDLVIKIGSMALVQPADGAIDYNIFQRLGDDLRPGMALVTSGATEIGRLDYLHRAGHELNGDTEQDKADYAAQGQIVLMDNYRKFVHPEYGIRQLLVEHTHFNDPQKREHILRLLQRAAAQNCIPIINYNDPVSDEENRKMELSGRRGAGEQVVECVDNDETAAVIAALLKAGTLVLLTSTEGVYRDVSDPSTLVKEVFAPDIESLAEKIEELRKSCRGASRKGAGGADAKLSYALRAAASGSHVIIGHARHHIADLISGKIPCTHIGVQ